MKPLSTVRVLLTVLATSTTIYFGAKVFGSNSDLRQILGIVLINPRFLGLVTNQTEINHNLQIQKQMQRAYWVWFKTQSPYKSLKATSC